MAALYRANFGDGTQTPGYADIRDAKLAIWAQAGIVQYRSRIEINTGDGWTVHTPSRADQNGPPIVEQPAPAPVRVVFRQWRGSGDVIALFPDVPADAAGLHCTSYERIGQHGAADYAGTIARTTAAAPITYAPLAGELRRIGYTLRIVTRR